MFPQGNTPVLPSPRFIYAARERRGSGSARFRGTFRPEKMTDFILGDITQESGVIIFRMNRRHHRHAARALTE